MICSQVLHNRNSSNYIKLNTLISQEVELKLEKLQNKNNVIQQNLDVDYIKKELYTMIKQEMDELQLFITEIKEQMNLLEKNVNSLDSKNKVKRLKETYLKEIQRNKAICRTLNNKSSFQSEKQNDEISIKSQSDTGGQPEMVEILPQRLDYNESNVQQSKISVEQDQKPLVRSSNILEKQQSVNVEQEQVVEQQEKVEEEEEEEEMNKYIYFIILVLVGIIAGLIVWLLYDENIL